MTTSYQRFFRTAGYVAPWLASKVAMRLWYRPPSRVASKTELLDVGCGWGSVLKRSVQSHGVKQAHGLTLSQKQSEWIQHFGIESISVLLKSWTEFAPDEPYDAIISIGAFEHFGRLDQT